jgi:hypothetical protein
LQIRREAAKIALELGRLQEVVGAAERDKLDLYAILSELSRIVPANVHVEETNLTMIEGISTLSLRGAVSLDDSEADPLSQFLGILRENQLIDTVDLGPTRVVEDHGIRNKEFSVNVRFKRTMQTASGEKP